jgi:mRNA interferase MazF
VDVVAQRFDVFLVSLDPADGSEMKKTRPCVVISPDEMNRHIRTVIVAPLTTRSKRHPTRVACTFARKRGEVVLDQIRTVDQTHLAKHLGRLDRATASKVLAALREIFA